MARGWESKSVEQQQSEVREKATSSSQNRMSPEQAAAFREKEKLRLSRSRVMQQIEASSNPRLREVLEHALADLDRKLEELS